MRKLPSLLVGTLLLSTACDKSSAPAAEPADGGDAPAASEPEAAAAEETPKTWADMDRQERMEHMGVVVYPAMKKAFQEHDAEQFAEFNCALCHGDDKEDVDFKMPNALTPLDAADPVADGMGIDEEMTKFMQSTVVPQMAEMLDRKPMAEGGDFGCLSCHLEG